MDTLVKIATIVSALTPFVLAASFILVRRQLEQNRQAAADANRTRTDADDARAKAERIQGFLASLDRLQSDEVRKARARIFLLRQEGNPVEKWSDDEANAGRLVCNSFDSAAQIVDHLNLSNDLLLKNWGDTIRRAWDVLEPYVIQCRKNDGWDHWSYFETLGIAAGDRYKGLTWTPPKFPRI